MLYGTVWASGIAAIGLMAISGSVNAGALAPVGASSVAVEPMVELARSNRSPSRGSRFGTAKSAAPCGVWICTWPTSNGGCLVKEKTKCKVINPF